jgi:glycerol-3-phosphate dehydrogenase (NAD(P)+)
MQMAVAGATSWGLTLASLVAPRCDKVTVLARTSEEASIIDTARGLPRLPSLTLPANVAVRPLQQVGTFDGLVVAVPSRTLRQFMTRLQDVSRVPLLSATKGLEPGTNLRMSQVLSELGFGNISVLSGPNLADEVSRGLPAAAVVASQNPDSAKWWQELVSTRTFRAYRAEDVVGVELAGALKNVVAIAAGAAAGMGFGANTIAAIVTRGLAEMTRLGVAMGANADTFRGLAGVGDLSATCFSPLSRNHRFGALLAGGHTPPDALAAIGQAVEGINAAYVAVELGRKHGLEMPISESVSAVLREERDVPGAMLDLLGRSLKHEVD